MNTSYKNLNIKIFVYILTLGFIMFAIISYISYKDYQLKIDNRFNELSKSLGHIIKAEEQRIVQLYRSRLIKNLKSYGVTEALKNQDRKRLYNLIKPRYDELRKENDNFVNMHFHTKDDISFLRMHKPDKYGDDLSKYRDIVVDTNCQKKFFSGFENGRFGYYYRIILPVIKNNEHLGSVEFGLTLGYFTQNLKRLMPDTNFGLVMNTQVDTNKKSVLIDDHKLIIDYNSFFQPIAKKIDLNEKYQLLEIKGRSYLISSNIYMRDYKGNDIIKILFATDITDYKKELINQFLFLLILGIFTYAISFIIINFGFQQYIRSIKSQSKKLKEYTDIIDEYVIVSSTDLKGNITYASDAFCKISGYTKKELLGRSHNLIRHPDMSKSTFKKMWNTITHQMIWKGEFKNRKKDGGYYWVDAVISPTYDENNQVTGYMAIRNDITDKKTIEEISQKDKLTQIYNRLKLDNELEKEITRTNRYKTPFSMILIDIDKFKSVNDTYGHQVGDIVLVNTAKILLSNIRKTDILGRWGGEEFLIICPNTTGQNSKILAENLREKLENFDFEVAGTQTASFGVTEFNPGEDNKSVLKRCDDALYKAKETGRNKVILK